jgi:hypothetical protein
MDNEPIEKSWWSRNWKWLVPAGCLAVILVGVVLVALFATTIVGVVFGAIRSSDVYQQALKEAQTNPAAVQALGTPIEPGLWVSGSISVTGLTGSADITIPVSGPKGSGTLYVVARKSAGAWEFTVLQLAVAGSAKRIDLLADRKEGVTPEASPSP